MKIHLGIPCKDPVLGASLGILSMVFHKSLCKVGGSSRLHEAPLGCFVKLYLGVLGKVSLEIFPRVAQKGILWCFYG